MLGLLLLSSFTFASSLVCSSEKLYYSNVRGDFGTKPPAGTVIGTVTLVYNGKTLLQYNSVAGLSPQGVPPYQFSLTGEQKILEKTGNQAYGTLVFKQTGALNKVDSLSGKIIEEVARETVVCQQLWRMVP